MRETLISQCYCNFDLTVSLQLNCKLFNSVLTSNSVCRSRQKWNWRYGSCLPNSCMQKSNLAEINVAYRAGDVAAKQMSVLCACVYMWVQVSGQLTEVFSVDVLQLLRCFNLILVWIHSRIDYIEKDMLFIISSTHDYEEYVSFMSVFMCFSSPPQL